MDEHGRGLMRVTTSKSHSSTCGWSTRAYRQLVANQFPYIQPISINWPLISSKGDARGRFSLASERGRAVSRACNTRSRAQEKGRRKASASFYLAGPRGIPFIAQSTISLRFSLRGLIHGIDVISRIIWTMVQGGLTRELSDRLDGGGIAKTCVNEEGYIVFTLCFTLLFKLGW